MQNDKTMKCDYERLLEDTNEIYCINSNDKYISKCKGLLRCDSYSKKECGKCNNFSLIDSAYGICYRQEKIICKENVCEHYERSDYYE